MFVHLLFFFLFSYYRYVLEPELLFTQDGALAAGPIANFTEVAVASLLTQNMHVPENWLVESVVTPFDLDNIRLKDVDSSVYRYVVYFVSQNQFFPCLTSFNHFSASSSWSIYCSKDIASIQLLAPLLVVYRSPWERKQILLSWILL